MVSQFSYNRYSDLFGPKAMVRKMAIKVSVHCDNNAGRKFTQEKTMLHTVQQNLEFFFGGGGLRIFGYMWRCKSKWATFHRWSLEN